MKRQLYVSEAASIITQVLIGRSSVNSVSDVHGLLGKTAKQIRGCCTHLLSVTLCGLCLYSRRLFRGNKETRNYSSSSSCVIRGNRRQASYCCYSSLLWVTGYVPKVGGMHNGYCN